MLADVDANASVSGGGVNVPDATGCMAAFMFLSAAGLISSIGVDTPMAGSSSGSDLGVGDLCSMSGVSSSIISVLVLYAKQCRVIYRK